jgi:hypothetical protein
LRSLSLRAQAMAAYQISSSSRKASRANLHRVRGS